MRLPDALGWAASAAFLASIAALSLGHTPGVSYFSANVLAGMAMCYYGVDRRAGPVVILNVVYTAISAVGLARALGLIG